MQQLDWHGYTILGQGVKAFSEEEVFSCTGGRHGKILLVENQDEHDLVSALQMIYGTACNVEITSGTSSASVTRYRSLYSRVYCTWDPLDSQR